jgi:hypothetical protein
MDDIEGMLFQSMVLVYKVGQKLNNTELADKAIKAGNQVSAVLKEYQGQTLTDTEKSVYGLYNDHQLDYGVTPSECVGRSEPDTSWLTQTK